MAHNLNLISSIPSSFTGRNQILCKFQHLGVGDTGFSSIPSKPFLARKPQDLTFKPFVPSSSSSPALSCRALGPNISEDVDDLPDDVYKKFGKVVFSKKDERSPTADVDEDAKNLAFAVEMARAADDIQADDIKVLFVKPLVYWTHFFVIVTAYSFPQIDAIRQKMEDVAEEKFGRLAMGEKELDSWTLLDFGDIVVHIFLPQDREYYNLEEFYANATPIKLPFVQKDNSTMRNRMMG